LQREHKLLRIPYYCRVRWKSWTRTYREQISR